MRLAIYVLEVIAIGLAWALVRQRREHLPVAVLLSVGLASDLAVLGIRGPILAAVAAHGVDVPWTGTARVAGHFSDAATLAWPAALVGAALVAFLRRKVWP